MKNTKNYVRKLKNSNTSEFTSIRVSMYYVPTLVARGDSYHPTISSTTSHPLQGFLYDSWRWPQAKYKYANYAIMAKNTIKGLG